MESKVVQKWYADWCAPCKRFDPMLTKVAEEFEVKVVPMNVEEHGELAASLNIRSIPSIALYEDDVLRVSRNGVGSITETNLRETFEAVYGENDESN